MTTAATTPERKPRVSEWARSAAGLRAEWSRAVAHDSWGYAVIDALALSDRTRRLFACACVRHPLVWGLLDDERSRSAVDVAECYADGLCGDAVLHAARESAWAAREAEDASWRAARAAAASAARATARAAAASAARAAAAADAADAADAAARAADAARAQMIDYQSRLLVSVVGPGWTLDPAWRTDTAVALARAMYDAREFSAMPILADALQDAGAPEDGELLAQLRDPAAVWARGARVLDELLGKR